MLSSLPQPPQPASVQPDTMPQSRSRIPKALAQVLTTLLLLLGITPTSLAQQPPNPQATQKITLTDGFDWIELTSGEWLKGDLKALYNRKLEFDSDKLDLLSLDWEDIRQVITHRPHMMLTEDRVQYFGGLRINNDEVEVIDVNGTSRKFHRDDLVSIVEGSPKEWDYWSFKLGLGATFQRGNTEQTDVNISARIRRRTAANRFSLDYMGQSTVIDNAETANNHRANSFFDVFASRRFFVRPIFTEYYRDRFQNVAHRITLGAGAGYTLIDTPRSEWNLYGGPAFQYTKFASVITGDSSEAKTPAFIAGSVYDTELNSWIDLYSKYDLTIANQRSGTYTHHFQTGLEIELTDILDLDLSVVWDHIQSPQQRDDGTVPEKNDIRLIAGISLDF
jgi:putative salt-induced outer membrane protein YdiY